jgi:hypothetical protein
VAVLGVVAVRRLGVIVALGALLGLFAGVVAAVPALAGGRGDGWKFAPAAPFTLPAEFCGFAVYVNPVAFKGFTKEFKTKDGTTAFLSTGTFKESLTNVDTGKTITENISGPATATVFPDHSVTLTFRGLGQIIFTPNIAARFGTPTVFLTAGRVTASFAPDGNITSFSLKGRVRLDVCAALS